MICSFDCDLLINFFNDYIFSFQETFFSPHFKCLSIVCFSLLILMLDFNMIRYGHWQFWYLKAESALACSFMCVVILFFQMPLAGWVYLGAVTLLLYLVMKPALPGELCAGKGGVGTRGQVRNRGQMDMQMVSRRMWKQNGTRRTREQWRWDSRGITDSCATFRSGPLSG